MSIRAMRAAMDAEIPDRGAKAVLVYLGDDANSLGMCRASVAWLAERAAFTRRTVQRKLRLLERMGYIRCRARDGASNVYQVDIALLETKDLFARVGGGRKNYAGDKITPVTFLRPHMDSKEERSKPILGSDKLNLRAHAREGKTGKAEGTPSKPKTDLAERLFRTLWGREWSNDAGAPIGEAAQFAALVYRTVGQINRGQIAKGTVMGYAGDCRDDPGVKHKGRTFAGLLKAHWARENRARETG